MKKFFALIVILMSLGANAIGQQKPLKDESGLISLDFVDADIRDIIKAMSEMTGKNFLIDKSVQGKITIISPTKVNPKEAYEIFLSILDINGFTVVQAGKVYKVITKEDARKSPLSIYEVPPPPSEAFITQLVPLEHISAVEIANTFRDMVTKGGAIISYAPSNTLIITDTAANIRRLLSIIDKLDIEGTEQDIVVIPLKYAPADLLSDQIVSIFEEEGASVAASKSQSFRARIQPRPQPGGSGGSEEVETPFEPSITKIIPDSRTNSLIVRANKLGMQRIRELVKLLDVPIPGGEGKVHVLYLQNADAEELAATLQSLFGGGGATTPSRKTQTGGKTPGSQGSSPLGGLSSPSGGLGESLGGGLSGIGGIGGISSSTAGGRTTGGTGAVAAELEGGVRIAADPSTNSLLIFAGNRDFQILKEVIEKLDIPRRQVFVEALIIEISLDKSRELGFEFRAPFNPESNGTQVLGGTGFGGIQAAEQNPLAFSGMAVGAVNGTITWNGQTFPNIAALFRAIQTDKDVNVLSTPTILTMDNEQAEIVVADNIPFITGQIFTPGLQGPTTTIERKDVGIKLQLTPQISEGEYVKLYIYQEVSNVTESPEGMSAANVGVTTSKRSATTTVVVKDNQTVIIGGLIKDYSQIAEQKVPLLGDIPILGYLFKNHKKTAQKTNLIIFITPHIARDARDLSEISKERYQKLEKFKEQNNVIEPQGREPFDKKRMEVPPEKQQGGMKEEEIKIPQEIEREQQPGEEATPPQPGNDQTQKPPQQQQQQDQKQQDQQQQDQQQQQDDDSQQPDDGDGKQ